MARGLVFLTVILLSQTAMALSDVERCARKADRLVKRQYAGQQVVRESFKNTTPGSYDQEYLGTYTVGGQPVTVEFYSPFICDRLEILSISK